MKCTIFLLTFNSMWGRLMPCMHKRASASATRALTTHVYHTRQSKVQLLEETVSVHEYNKPIGNDE